MRPVLRLLRLSQYPILKQLKLEQALLRVAQGSWLLVNDGTPDPAIVMGISGKLDELVYRDKALAREVTVIRRFSGGGTVVVDRNTVFATMISDDIDLPDVEALPRPLMEWTTKMYEHAFGKYGKFRLRENDYCFGERKFAGNAQAITRKRWLHHTTFLWDYEPRNMALLRHPSNAPAYREGREHSHFICSLKDCIPSRQELLESIAAAMESAGFQLQEVTFAEAHKYMEKEHFKSTKIVPL